jgi:predicted aldo/keto reductase-like oxidoreductase
VGILEGSWELTGEEQRALEDFRAQAGTRFCRRCGYCEPCPEGVSISLVMNARSFWKRFPVDRFAGGWIAQGVESARQCIECGECEEKCPYLLPIREMLVENLEFYESVIA